MMHDSDPEPICQHCSLDPCACDDLLDRARDREMFGGRTLDQLHEDPDDKDLFGEPPEAA